MCLQQRRAERGRPRGCCLPLALWMGRSLAVVSPLAAAMRTACQRRGPSAVQQTGQQQQQQQAEGLYRGAGFEDGGRMRKRLSQLRGQAPLR